MERINLKSLISIQARFETIFGERGEEFLDLCGRLNVNLEFGLQTASEIESAIIKRKNNPEKIRKVMQKINDRNISYEVSLIYGLPMQTLNSFQESIDFVYEEGCKKVIAFPLMLLKGTELYDQKEKYGFQERCFGDFNIPVAVSSHSFTEKDWYKMKEIASNLVPAERI